MICTNCGKSNAAVYRCTSNGKEVSVRLCASCYKKLYPKEGKADIFTRFMGEIGEKKSKICHNCGLSLSEYRQTGLLGCAKCYEYFREELIPTVRFIQWEVRHEGKTPSANAEKNYDRVCALLYERDALYAELERAKSERDYSAVRDVEAELEIIKRKIKKLGENA